MPITEDDVTAAVEVWTLYINKRFAPTNAMLERMLKDCEIAPDGDFLLDTLSHWCKFSDPRSRTWANFARHLAEKVAERAGAQRTEAGEKCPYCGDSGYMPVACPVSVHGEEPDRAGYVPGRPWAATPVYEKAVPCICKRGEKGKRPAAEWLDLRDRWIEYFAEHEDEGSPPVLVSRHLQDCAKAAQEAPAPAGVIPDDAEDVDEDEIPF